MRRIHVNPDRDTAEVYKYSQVIDAQIPTKVDFSSVATDRGTTVSSIEWDSSAITASGQALASGVASANLSSAYCGKGILKVIATMVDATKEVVFIKINVENPR